MNYKGDNISITFLFLSELAHHKSNSFNFKAVILFAKSL